MKVDVFDKTGKKVEQLDLNDSVFGIAPNSELLSRYVRIFRTNQRQGTSSTKTRSEISGGGKKPWRQKGTGRARHGSTRSPLWRHGGVAHGPKPKSWRLSMPKKMGQKALLSALSFKLSEKGIKVLQEFDIKEPKTKVVDTLLGKLKLVGSTIIVLGENDMNFRKSARNIKGVSVVLVDTLNPYELLASNNVLFMKNAILKVEEKYANK